MKSGARSAGVCPGVGHRVSQVARQSPVQVRRGSDHFRCSEHFAELPGDAIILEQTGDFDPLLVNHPPVTCPPTPATFARSKTSTSAVFEHRSLRKLKHQKVPTVVPSFWEKVPSGVPYTSQCLTKHVRIWPRKRAPRCAGSPRVVWSYGRLLFSGKGLRRVGPEGVEPPTKGL